MHIVWEQGVAGLPHGIATLLRSSTCKKYASLEMYIWSGVLLQLCYAIHNRPFKLAHGEDNRFHVMVFRCIVGSTFSGQFSVGTP